MHVDGFRSIWAPPWDGAATSSIHWRSSFRCPPDPVLAKREDDRGALGHGPERLQVGEFPGLARMNGKLPRPPAALLEGDVGGRRAGLTVCGQPGNLQPGGRHAGEHQLHHLPRRFHAGRSLELRPEAQRGQRRANRDGDRDNRSLELRRGGRTEVRGNQRPHGGQMRTSWPPSSSPGVPISPRGTSAGATQGGNNNAYCQDNHISWVSWELDDARGPCSARWPRRLPQPPARPSAPQLLQGAHIWDSEFKDLAWRTGRTAPR